MEQTFAMIKPSGVQRHLIGEIIKRIEQKGITINSLKMLWVTEYQARKHYDVHSERPFFEDLVQSLMEGPVVAMILSGEHCVEIIRLLAGATDPTKSLPGTIRGDFSSDLRLNIIHTADSIDRAKYEMSIYFTNEEIVKYEKIMHKQIYSKK